MKYVANRALIFTESGTKHSLVFEEDEFDDVEAFREIVAKRFEQKAGVQAVRIHLTYEEKGE